MRVQSDPIAWAPGQGAVRMPEGTGVRVPSNAVLVFQVHYNLADPANVGSSDETIVNVKFDSEVETPIRPVYIDYFLEDFRNNAIPRGEAAYEFRREADMRGTRSGRPIKIWGILPHMHERGQQLTATLKRPMVPTSAWYRSNNGTSPGSVPTGMTNLTSQCRKTYGKSAVHTTPSMPLPIPYLDGELATKCA